MDRQEVFNNILSNLEYDNINYDVVSECGKTVVYIHCSNGTMKLTVSKIRAAEKCLIDNGIEPDEASTVLQAIGYILLDTELYPDTLEEE